ncbi:hypothetical protein B0H13DRAFT_2666810 [Mycena leptocephala]|nr:hypothetical protein B0H13DRAFT_2666810 [Mycena leptocephala]
MPLGSTKTGTCTAGATPSPSSPHSRVQRPSRKRLAHAGRHRRALCAGVREDRCSGCAAEMCGGLPIALCPPVPTLSPIVRRPIFPSCALFARDTLEDLYRQHRRRLPLLAPELVSFAGAMHVDTRTGESVLSLSHLALAPSAALPTSASPYSAAHPPRPPRPSPAPHLFVTYHKRLTAVSPVHDLRA